MTKEASERSGGPKRQLGLFDATCIIVGIIIGSAIYKSTPLIASNVKSPEWLLAAWALGGAISLLGALCYSELTTSYPEEGGDYVYLSRAFGKQAGFLFAWAEYWIVRPGNVGMMAFVFATFSSGLLGVDSSPEARRIPELLLASGAIVVLTVMNILGVQTGKMTQNILASIKVVGLIAIIFVGLFWNPSQSSLPSEVSTAIEAPAESEVPNDGDFRLAMILVLFAYGGWNEISYVAAEVRNPNRNLRAALILGVLAVTVLYVLVNVAFLRAIGLDGIANAKQFPADVFREPFGDWGARTVNLLVCISALGAANGMLFTGARIYYAVGSDNPLVAWLGKWSGTMDSPVRALVLQGMISVALIVGFGWFSDGFERLTLFTTPVYWFFAFMVGISLMVLRWQDQDRPRPHKVLLYPWIPLLFCLTCALLFESSFTYALTNRQAEASWAIGLMAVGVAITALFGNRKAS